MTEPEIEFPEMVEENIDISTLMTLVSDLTNVAHIEQVIVKGGEFELASQGDISLPDAVELLLDKKVRGVQIRYRWDNIDWFDTLLNAPQGVKIVRVKAPTLK